MHIDLIIKCTAQSTNYALQEIPDLIPWPLVNWLVIGVPQEVGTIYTFYVVAEG